MRLELSYEVYINKKIRMFLEYELFIKSENLDWVINKRNYFYYGLEFI